jgi:catechol 2,3-dioxygenase-like lactoylglutathione lyase family enzyme
MRLNHLDLHVPDVAVARDFFVAVFGLTAIETRGRDGLAILNDDTGFELVLSRPIEKFGGADTVSAGVNTYHIGFMLPEREDVDAVYTRLISGGYEAWHEPRAIRGGWLFYAIGPGSILIEVGWRTAPVSTV